MPKKEVDFSVLEATPAFVRGDLEYYADLNHQDIQITLQAMMAILVGASRSQTTKDLRLTIFSTELEPDQSFVRH